MVGLEYADGSSRGDLVNIEGFAPRFFFFGFCARLDAAFSALGKVLHWLGPLEHSERHRFYPALSDLLSQLWFHGAVGTGEAERLLKGREEGTFLIRFR